MAKRLTVKEMLLFTMCAVIVFACKTALAALPNIELVTFLLIIFSSVIGIRTIYIVFVYVMLEIILYGMGFWVCGYLFLWPFLVCLTVLLKEKIKKSNLLRAVISAIFGFCFDLFYALIICLISGFWTGVTYFIGGIVFSTVHMISNYFIMLLLGEKLYLLFSKMYIKYKLDEW
jgi:energy-coupling factor transport system substrate-specific component